MKRRAFTLPELIVVLVIMGLLGIVSFIALDPYQGVKLDGAAKKLQADLQYTRNIALSTAKFYGISFEVDPVNTYTVYITSSLGGDTIIENPANLGKDFVINIHDYYGGVRIQSVDIAGGSKVEFHPLGRPYNDMAGSPIASDGVITLEYRGATREVVITNDTGRITVQ
jgi:prepilin-type N-terminal cleavage/methylation domain-containing protein